MASGDAASAAPIRSMSVFNDLWNSKFVGSIQWIYDEQDHERLLRHPLLPGGAGDPRPDGELPGPGDGPAGGHEGLLQRRQRDQTHEADINKIAEAGITGGCEPGQVSAGAAFGQSGPDGRLPGSCARPAAGHQGLLQRRRQRARWSPRSTPWPRPASTGGCGAATVLPTRPRSRASRWRPSSCGRSSPTDRARLTPPPRPETAPDPTGLPRTSRATGPSSPVASRL